MKKITLLKSVLLLCALVAGSGSVWAEDQTATFDFDTNAGNNFGITGTSSTSSTAGDITSTVSATINNVTMNITPKTSGTTENRFWESSPKLRLYAGAFTISTIGYNIKSIAFTTGSGKFDTTPSTGSVSGSKTAWSWSGSASTITFTINSNTQIKKIIVTYENDKAAITPSTEYSTLTSSLALDFTSVSSDLKAYIATSVSDASVQMTQINKVPANTGLVLKATTPGTAVKVPILTTTPDNVSANKMAGSATAKTNVAANAGYILKSGVFQPSSGGDLPAGKAYLAIAASPAHTLDLDFGNGEVTSISAIAKDAKNVGEYYNLAGQRVAQPTKGMYIVNGKKVIMK